MMQQLGLSLSFFFSLSFPASLFGLLLSIRSWSLSIFKCSWGYFCHQLLMFLHVFMAEVVDDATVGMIIVILLFILPFSLSFWPFVEHTKLFTISGQLRLFLLSAFNVFACFYGFGCRRCHSSWSNFWMNFLTKFDKLFEEIFDNSFWTIS